MGMNCQREQQFEIRLLSQRGRSTFLERELYDISSFLFLKQEISFSPQDFKFYSFRNQNFPQEHFCLIHKEQLKVEEFVWLQYGYYPLNVYHALLLTKLLKPHPERWESRQHYPHFTGYKSMPQGGGMTCQWYQTK